MTIEELLKDLYKINGAVTKYKELHAAEYKDYCVDKFFQQPKKHTLEFQTELSVLVSRLDPSFVSYTKLEENKVLKQKIAAIILDIESDLEYFKNAPRLEEDPKKLCEQAILKLKEIEKEMGVDKKKFGVEIKS